LYVSYLFVNVRGGAGWCLKGYKVDTDAIALRGQATVRGQREREEGSQIRTETKHQS